MIGRGRVKIDLWITGVGCLGMDWIGGKVKYLRENEEMMMREQEIRMDNNMTVRELRFGGSGNADG